MWWSEIETRSYTDGVDMMGFGYWILVLRLVVGGMR